MAVSWVAIERRAGLSMIWSLGRAGSYNAASQSLAVMPWLHGKTLRYQTSSRSN
jgi:hypothetical protein